MPKLRIYKDKRLLYSNSIVFDFDAETKSLYADYSRADPIAFEEIQVNDSLTAGLAESAIDGSFLYNGDDKVTFLQVIDGPFAGRLYYCHKPIFIKIGQYRYSCLRAIETENTSWLGDPAYIERGQPSGDLRYNMDNFPVTKKKVNQSVIPTQSAIALFVQMAGTNSTYISAPLNPNIYQYDDWAADGLSRTMWRNLNWSLTIDYAIREGFTGSDRATPRITTNSSVTSGGTVSIRTGLSAPRPVSTTNTEEPNAKITADSTGGQRVTTTNEITGGTATAWRMVNNRLCGVSWDGVNNAMRVGLPTVWDSNKETSSLVRDSSNNVYRRTVSQVTTVSGGAPSKSTLETTINNTSTFGSNIQGAQTTARIVYNQSGTVVTSSRTYQQATVTYVLLQSGSSNNQITIPNTLPKMQGFPGGCVLLPWSEENWQFASTMLPNWSVSETSPDVIVDRRIIPYAPDVIYTKQNPTDTVNSFQLRNNRYSIFIETPNFKNYRGRDWNKETDVIVIRNPSGSERIEINPFLNNSNLSGILIEATLKPMNCEYDITPSWDGEYGQVYSDKRCITDRDDYGVSYGTTQWIQMMTQAPNYFNSFNRGLENLDVNQGWQERLDSYAFSQSKYEARNAQAQRWAASTPLLGNLTGPLGLIGGENYGAGASIMQGAALDLEMNNALRAETRQLMVDQFNMNVANIQARPSIVSKIDVITEKMLNNLGVVIEIWSVNDDIFNSVLKFKEWNSEPINTHGRFLDFVKTAGESRGFLRGKIIRSSSYTQAELQQINERLSSGVYYNGI